MKLLTSLLVSSVVAKYDWTRHAESKYPYKGGRDTRESKIIPLDADTAEFIDVRCASKKGAAGYNYKADNAVDGKKYEAEGPLKLAHSYGGKSKVTWTANWKSFYDWTTDVGTVRIWFRKDCCYSEHKNIKVEIVGNSQMWGGECKPEAELTAEYIKEQIDKDEPVYFYCPYHTRGKYVLISNYGGKELIFHEVEVWSFPWSIFEESTTAPPTTPSDGVPGCIPGQECWVPFKEREEVKALKPVAGPYYNLFSGYYGAPGSKAEYLWDGDMNTYAQGRLTGSGVNSYYRNRNAKLTEVHVWPRTDTGFDTHKYLTVYFNKKCEAESDLDEQSVKNHVEYNVPLVFKCPEGTKTTSSRIFSTGNLLNVVEVELWE